MKFYKITQKFYNSGKVNVSLSTVEGEKIPTDMQMIKQNYDYYEDHFNHHKDAIDFYKKCKNL